MSVLHVNKNSFQSIVKESAKPVLVDFWASWCGPCRMIAPVLEEIAVERPDVKVCKVNIDEQEALAQRFNVMNIPTVIAFQNGAEMARSVGLVPKEKLLELL